MVLDVDEVWKSVGYNKNLELFYPILEGPCASFGKTTVVPLYNFYPVMTRFLPTIGTSSPLSIIALSSWPREEPEDTSDLNRSPVDR